MEDLYFYSSKLEYADFLNKIEEFRRPFELHDFEIANMHRNEYGFLKFKNIRLKFLLGNICEFKCPWCAIEPIYNEEMLEYFSDRQTYKMFFECPNCRSRGPLKFMTVFDDKELDRIRKCIKALYMEQLPWDHNFKKEKKDKND